MTTSDDCATPSVALLSTTSAAILTLLPVAAHQLGWLKHLPDPAGAIFASDEITESKAAHPFGVPDALMGIASYGMTLCLLFAARRKPGFGKVAKAKLLTDGSLASANMVRQILRFRRLCSWCTGTAICTVAMLIAGRRFIFRDRSPCA